MANDPPNSGGSVDATGLISLLEWVERPAGALTPSGLFLGVNQRFRELALTRGRPPHDRIDSLLNRESREVVAALFQGVQPGIRVPDQPVTLLDGTPMIAKFDVIASSAGTPLILVVFQPPQAKSAGQTAAMLRHDIAGPLTAILGTAELLLIRGENLAPEIKESLGQILENCGRISEILHKSRAMDRGGGGGGMR